MPATVSPPALDVRFASARFAISVAKLEALNDAGLPMLPELAFVGRSNAGKSSVINVLTAQRRLAFASKTPGRTQLLNFFTVDGRSQVRGEPLPGPWQPCAHLVDLPGYGFAKTDEATRASWDRLVGGYLQQRRRLAGVVLVMDARHPLRPTDEALLAFLEHRADADKVRLHLLLNKIDQLGQSDRVQAVRAAESRAEATPLAVSVQAFSALKLVGVDELRETLAQIIESAPAG
jgi:GTP-binding protein